MKRDPRHTMLPMMSLAAMSLLAIDRPRQTTIHIGLDDYEPMPPRPLKEARKPVEISPLTGRQPLANPSSNRKAQALQKAMRRQARQRQEPAQ